MNMKNLDLNPCMDNNNVHEWMKSMHLHMYVVIFENK